MAKMIFVNLPVTDLERSMAFYEAMVAADDPQFTDDTAACMVLSDRSSQCCSPTTSGVNSRPSRSSTPTPTRR